ncbi:MAG: outer membrane protein assembly factor [Gammaproteobacteria bacterium]|nr:outer membrane protein assembly factor [Gammaproteobacteria bacterium]
MKRTIRELLMTGCLACPLAAGADLVFSGLAPELEANARALMPLAAASCDASPSRIQRLYRDAGDSLQRSLRAMGYYNARFKADIEWPEGCWVARFDVDPGEPVRLAEVRIDAAIEQATAGKPEPALAPLVSGEILNHGRYEAYKAALLNDAISRGYFDARYKHAEVLVDRQANTASVVLELDAGEQYRFGEVIFTQGIIKDSLLRGYSDIRSGETYQSAAIDDLYESLRDSSYFSSISISTEPLDKQAKTVPVQVELEPGPRRVYSVGAGFATDTGPQGKISFVNRRVNDKGHQLESRLFGSEIKSEFSTTYRWPRSDPRSEWYSLSGGFLHEETDTSENDTSKLGLTYSKARSGSWLETRYIDFLSEDFIIGDEAGSSDLLLLGFNWESVRGRELSRTRNGRRLSLDVRGASDSAGSDTSFVQLRANAKWIHSFSDFTRVLVRARVGITFEDSLEELPASVRFLAGGDQSIRGYDFEELGPVGASGRIIGGENLLEASIEIEKLVRDQWAVAGFVDTGSAFIGSDFEASTGVGVGVRWYSPIGPVRLDFAHPLDDPDRSWRIHITLGPDL